MFDRPALEAGRPIIWWDASPPMSEGDFPLVLVVDASPTDQERLVSLLKSEGYESVTETTTAGGLHAFAERLPDLVILDLSLPDHSGLDLCRELRARSLVPIVAMSYRSEEIDVVCALDLGADDYVIKPYRDHELAARIRAHLRRAPLTASGTFCTDRNAIRTDELCLNPVCYQATIGGIPLDLGRKEFELLEVLATNSDRVVPRQVLLDRVWGPDYLGAGRALDMHIARLRRKLQAYPASSGRIVTVRGLGYKYLSKRAQTRSSSGAVRRG